MIRSTWFVAVPVIVTLLAVFAIRLALDILREYREIREPQGKRGAILAIVGLNSIVTVYFAAKAWLIFFLAL